MPKFLNLMKNLSVSIYWTAHKNMALIAHAQDTSLNVHADVSKGLEISILD